MEYSTDPAGLNKEYRLELLPEKGLPAVRLMAVTGKIQKKKVFFTEKNNNASFNDDLPNPFSVATAAGLLWGVRETMIVFQKYFGWNGLNNAGKLLDVELIEENFSNAYFSTDEERIKVLGDAGINVPDVSIGAICHEFTHGVFYYRGYNTGVYSNQYLAISESLSDIFSVFVKKEVEKAASYNWICGDATKAGGFRNFENPNLTFHPDTYGDTFWQEWDDPKFNPHVNASVINHCFYHLAQGSGGPKKNFHGTPYNCVGIGVPKAIEIFWGAMDGLSTESTFFDLRKRTLEVVHKMGHPTGSELDLAVREGWKSVGLGQDLAITDVICETGKTAESIFYGQVPINTGKGDVIGDAQAGKINVLVDCVNKPQIHTLIADPTTAIHFIDSNDADQIYTIDNDEKLSKQGVTVHFATRLAHDYFQAHHNFSSMDGNGTTEIWNYVGDPLKAYSHGYNQVTKFFKYDNDNTRLSIDQIAGTYFSGIYYNVKNVQSPELGESIAVRLALADIFGLEVNNEYRVSKNQQPIWTIGADAFSGNEYLRSFSNPTLKGQLNFYKSPNWAFATPEQMAGVWTQFYYLISNGSGLNGYTNADGQTKFILKLKEGVPAKIMFTAFHKFLSDNPTFPEMALAILSSVANNGYSQKSTTWKTCKDALDCVLGQNGVNPPDLWAVDGNGDPAKEVDPLNAMFRANVLYPGKEGDRLFEVSENQAFKDELAPVYRAFQHTSEVLLPYIDEKDPGEQTSSAKFYLEGGKQYFVRSRLFSANGPGCASSIGGPLECRDLEKMTENWSTTLEVTTLPIISNVISPLENDKVDAWGSKFNWHATPGAAGYVMRVTDLSGAVPVMDRPFKSTSDESESVEIALAKERGYSWQIVATHKLGSEEGVSWDKVSKTLVKTGLTDVDIFGEWTGSISFKTSLPETPLLVPPGPADVEHVPPFGEDILLSAEEAPGATGYRYHIQDKKDDMEVPLVLYDHENLKLPDISNGKVYTWAFEPYKEATPPFITEKEFGKKYFSTFVVDYSLVPAPVLLSPVNDAVFNFGTSTPDQVFSWSPVAGAVEYDYSVDFAEDEVTDNHSSTSETSVAMDVGDVSTGAKGGFRWRVRAKAKDEKGDWIEGPYSPLSFYWLRPEKTNLKYPSDGAQTVDNHKAEFSWYEQWAPAGHLFRLWKDNVIVFEKEVFGKSITITNLEVNTDYTWDAPAMTKTPTATHFPETYTFAHFRTGNAQDEEKNGKEIKEYDPNEDEAGPGDPNDPNDPDQGSGDVFYPQLGFTVDVKDGEFADTYSYSYKVTVTSDKGYSREWNCAVNGLGVVFIPEDLFQTKVNGDLPEDTALYHFHLEITDLNGKDDSYAASPTYDFALLLYDALPAVQGKKMPLLDSIPQSGVFGGRWVGCSIDFDFEYTFSTKKPKP
ncbi:M4 family metallopeptidase [Dyadobacter fanqingshengii]|uniref:M4 family metallopeptidase n=1 Tax=Dyadobacter fanqingshengii TaxID=2906443 RepID=A0A9X1T8L9_9BACT|nr:M4 family metallopeptidase [Dyadobacter fanqingshengii]MCF0039019.1 M4 family metallopeptidase [Dyadobacter fanqingshengii]USJ34159.1 M4 family metallopeptidase [Dyadobacter fanqingshengii]